MKNARQIVLNSHKHSFITIQLNRSFATPLNFKTVLRMYLVKCSSSFPVETLSTFLIATALTKYSNFVHHIHSEGTF